MTFASTITNISDTALSIHAKYGTASLAIAFVAFGVAWYYLIGRRDSTIPKKVNGSDGATHSGDDDHDNNNTASTTTKNTTSSQANTKSTTNKPQRIASTKSASNASSKEGEQQELRNVFSVKQNPPNTTGRRGPNNNDKGETTTERPFGSSYYYAHNNANSKGGYKDGLRAEDYVMNGPRLLSKGGVRVDDAADGADDGSEDLADSKTSNDIDHSNTDATSNNTKLDSLTDSNSAKNKGKQTSKQKLISSTPITRYLWDDDSEGNTAKIHIDTLPLSSTSTIPWEEACISKQYVEVRLIGERNDGLFVGVTQQQQQVQEQQSQKNDTTISTGKKYHLHIPKMYGEADSVKAIVKKHKLLIKITKKKIPSKRYSNRHSQKEDGILGMVSGAWEKFTSGLVSGGGGGEGGGGKEELVSVAWPRLSSSSAGGLGGGTTEIDEKLFREMDIKGGTEFFE